LRVDARRDYRGDYGKQAGKRQNSHAGATFMVYGLGSHYT
jgi:hypothetical protein